MSALAPLGRLAQEIATVSTVPEAKALCDKAEALRVYWRQAGDRDPEIRAAEIRIRAERRLGELMLAYAAAGLIRPGSPGRTRTGSIGSDAERITLVAAGIEPRLADRARQYARMPATDFEDRLVARRTAIERGKKRVSLFLVDQHDKAERRAAREAELGARQCALPERRYGVILADPEWAFEPWSVETGMDRAAANHYPTSPTAAIEARPVADIAADDCVLLLWAIPPMLPDAIRVMAAWGFGYRTNAVWEKDRVGTGYWFRFRHEHLLLGLRGTVPCPAPGQQWDSILEAPVGRHSQKPELVLELAEAYFPSLPKIELNRRGPARPGWDAWGNEAETVAA